MRDLQQHDLLPFSVSRDDRAHTYIVKGTSVLCGYAAQWGKKGQETEWRRCFPPSLEQLTGCCTRSDDAYLLDQDVLLHRSSTATKVRRKISNMQTRQCHLKKLSN